MASTHESPGPQEQLRSELFLDLVNELEHHIGEPITARLIATIGKLVLDKELMPEPTDEHYTPKDITGGLAGIAESAELLGLTKQRISQLVKEGKMPPLVARLRATPIWRRSDVEDFARKRNHTSSQTIRHRT